MTCRYCLLACMLCNILSTASHFLSAFCLVFFHAGSLGCVFALYPLFQRFSLCWIFSLCSQGLYCTEKEPNAHELTAVSEANWKSSHLDLPLSGVCSSDLVPGTDLFCIHHVGRAICTIIPKTTASTTRQDGLNSLKIWCLPP